MKCSILTEAGGGAGFGHLTRCISLVQALKEHNEDASLIVAGAEQNEIRSYAQDYIVKLYNWHQDKEFLNDCLLNTDLAIVDSYICTEAIYRYIADRVSIMLCLDDYNRLKYPQGIVLNGSIGAASLPYPESSEITYLLGPLYQPMRKEFWNVSPLTIRKHVKNILLFFGGNDLRDLNSYVSKKLRQNFAGIKLHILTRDNRLASDDMISVYPVQSAGELIKLFNEMDLVITAGGQSMYELARIGLPPIVIKVAENQSINIQGWMKTDYINYIGEWDRLNTDIICTAIENSIPQEVRIKMHLAGLVEVDGMGAGRTVETVLNKI